MKKTLTKTQISKEYNRLKRELYRIHNKLDKLLEESEKSYEACNEKEMETGNTSGKADALNAMTTKIYLAVEDTLRAYQEL